MTAIPVACDPPRASTEEIRTADSSSLRIPALAGVPVAVVTSETSTTAANGLVMVKFLTTTGAAARQLHLPDYGVLGNRHGLVFEKNREEL